MTNCCRIAGYARISVDEELDRDNTSIENQKAIIGSYVKERFPGSSLVFYEDRDRSGYTFEQREQYQIMRRELIAHRLDILIVKDFSRFSRRNSKGLVELEDLRDAGVRIISIGDGVDIPNEDDWLKVQFQFLINEMPVTDTSKKIKAVIRRRQGDGNWICAAPYGYVINRKSEFEVVPEQASVVQKIFSLYIDEGYGYKRIAKYLTEHQIPTPRMSMKMRMEAEGDECRYAAKNAWSLITVQEILDNDFYIGTLRQGKYARAKINGRDLRKNTDDHIVIEHHHEPIIEYKTFLAAREQKAKRTTSHYRGVKKYNNVYSGFLRCGDCGAPMFCRNRANLATAYLCGTYFRLGKAHCSAHTIRADRLDELIKGYIRRVVDSSARALDGINRELSPDGEYESDYAATMKRLESTVASLREEMKATKRQRIRDIMKHPEREDELDDTYDELEKELQDRMDGIAGQIEFLNSQNSDRMRVNRSAKTVLGVMKEILEKDELTKRDISLVIDHITVFEDHIEVELQSDVDAILGTADNGDVRDVIQPTDADGVGNIGVDVVREGDPLLSTLTSTAQFMIAISKLCRRIFGDRG